MTTRQSILISRVHALLKIAKSTLSPSDVDVKRTKLVAATMLELCEQLQGKRISHEHLSCLVYIAHGHMLQEQGMPLVLESFVATGQGPQLPSLRFSLKNTKESLGPAGYALAAGRLPYEAIDVMRRVASYYGAMDLQVLQRAMREEGTPWDKSFVSQGAPEKIDDGIIADHFERISQARPVLGL